MQSIKGKALQTFDLEAISDWACRYEAITLDLGTGDGEFVRRLARRQPETGVIGVDTCGAKLRDASRRAPENGRFIVADALTLPPDLHHLATSVTINFPWGSLLRALLDGDDRLMESLAGKPLEIRVNGGAIAETGYTLEEGSEAIRRHLRRITPGTIRTRLIEREELRSYPTTWAKRLAFGRDPRAVEVTALTRR